MVSHSLHGLRVKIRVGFRVRHLIVMVRVTIKGLGNALCLCPRKDRSTLRQPNTRCTMMSWRCSIKGTKNVWLYSLVAAKSKGEIWKMWFECEASELIEVDLHYERRHMQSDTILTDRDQEVFTHSQADLHTAATAALSRTVSLLQPWRSWKTHAEDLCPTGPTHGHTYLLTAWAPDWSKLFMPVELNIHHHEHQYHSSGRSVVLTSWQNCTGSFFC